jgi:hypothetical protein
VHYACVYWAHHLIASNTGMRDDSSPFKVEHCVH